jgi:arylsulfatase A-like enzyme
MPKVLKPAGYVTASVGKCTGRMDRVEDSAE